MRPTEASDATNRSQESLQRAEGVRGEEKPQELKISEWGGPGSSWTSQLELEERTSKHFSPRKGASPAQLTASQVVAEGP